MTCEELNAHIADGTVDEEVRVAEAHAQILVGEVVK